MYRKKKHTPEKSKTDKLGCTTVIVEKLDWYISVIPVKSM